MRSGWPLIIRTKLMDDLILTSVAEGCGCVLNLAAGFDTRPYRLALPATLRWVEADLPAMIDEKERLLAGEKPVCRLVREKVDLANVAARSAFLASALQNASKALVITEGLLAYLDEEVVRLLAKDLQAHAAIRWWLLDTASPVILEILQKSMGKHLANAPFKFAPANGLTFFEALGWQTRDVRSVFREAGRYRRLNFFFRLLSMLPGPDPRNLGRARWSAVVRFERS
jgi:methyltransferase (TIGR00027 family)